MPARKSLGALGLLIEKESIAIAGTNRRTGGKEIIR
jgi:hypothetical protein